MPELQFQVEAYQSYLWNMCAEQLVKENSSATKLPMIGFGVEIDSLVEPVISKILATEGITQRSFIMHELPQISAEGRIRDIFIEIKDLTIGELKEDDLNPGMKKCLIAFTIPKGSYGTELIKQLFQ
jgi:tRNA(Glu) U13 pseudouridine synthase TruD